MMGTEWLMTLGILAAITAFGLYVKYSKRFDK